MYQQLTWEFRISCADQNFPKEENGQFTVSSLIFLLHKIEQRNLFQEARLYQLFVCLLVFIVFVLACYQP